MKKSLITLFFTGLTFLMISCSGIFKANNSSITFTFTDNARLASSQFYSLLGCYELTITDSTGSERTWSTIQSGETIELDPGAYTATVKAFSKGHELLAESNKISFTLESGEAKTLPVKIKAVEAKQEAGSGDGGNTGGDTGGTTPSGDDSGNQGGTSGDGDSQGGDSGDQGGTTGGNTPSGEDAALADPETISWDSLSDYTNTSATSWAGLATAISSIGDDATFKYYLSSSGTYTPATTIILNGSSRQLIYPDPKATRAVSISRLSSLSDEVLTLNGAAPGVQTIGDSTTKAFEFLGTYSSSSPIISINGNGLKEIINCYFENNYNSPAIQINTSKVVLKNCYFFNNNNGDILLSDTLARIEIDGIDSYSDNIKIILGYKLEDVKGSLPESEFLLKRIKSNVSSKTITVTDSDSNKYTATVTDGEITGFTAN